MPRRPSLQASPPWGLGAACVLGGKTGVSALDFPVGIHPFLRRESHVEVECDGGFSGSEDRHPFSVAVLFHGFAACRPEKGHEVPCRLQTAGHVQTETVPLRVAEFLRKFVKFLPVFRRRFRVEPDFLKQVFAPHQNTDKQFAWYGPDVIPRCVAVNAGAFPVDHRADRCGSVFQKCSHSPGIVPFNEFIQRIQKRLLNIGVRHPEVDSHHVRRTSSCDRKHDFGLVTDSRNRNSAESRQFNIRIKPAEFAEYLQTCLALGIRGFRVRQIIELQRDFQNFLLFRRRGLCLPCKRSF